MSETTRGTEDYSAAFAKIERAAEEHAPGVLDLIETYQNTMPQTSAWQPVNASSISYATGVNGSEAR
jgi:hypothetical protein